MSYLYSSPIDVITAYFHSDTFEPDHSMHPYKALSSTLECN